MKKLEIGPWTEPDGTVVRLDPSWETLTAVNAKNVDYVARWGYETLPLEDNTYDLIHASHVLEHIDHWRVVDALKETFRILKPGGTLEIHVPNILWLIRQWRSGECDKWRGHDLIAYKDGKPVPGSWFNTRVLGFSESSYWEGDRQHYCHRVMFDDKHLEWCLREAGFGAIQFCGAPRGPEKHGGVNDPNALTLNLSRSGKKPA
jgi:SAM-dependent methyltransferase